MKSLFHQFNSDRKIAPRNTAPQQISPWVRVRVGGNFPSTQFNRAFIQANKTNFLEGESSTTSMVPYQFNQVTYVCEEHNSFQDSKSIFMIGEFKIFADVFQNRCYQEFCNIHMKTPVLESFFNKVARQRTAILLKRDSITGVVFL